MSIVLPSQGDCLKDQRVPADRQEEESILFGTAPGRSHGNGRL